MTQALLTPYFLDEKREYSESGNEFQAQTNPAELDTSSEEIQQRVLPLYSQIKEFVRQSAENNETALALNGDCVMTIPVLAGLQAAGVNPLLVWFDAHGDFNTWETSPSGFLGGMPLAMMVGKGEQSLVDAMGQQQLPEADVILTDGRDLDPEEGQMVADSAMVHLPEVAELLEYELPDRPLWVHFDCDVMHLDDLPAVSYPAKGGPSVVDVAFVFDKLQATGNIVAVSTTLPNPDFDIDGSSRDLVHSLLKRLL